MLNDSGATARANTEPEEEAPRGKKKPEKKLQGHAITFPEYEIWEGVVDGETLLDDIVVQIKRFLVVPDYSAEAVALWIILTYISEKASVLPMLVFNSATKRCGKTTALEIVSRLSKKALPASTISAPALFRVVEQVEPCLIIDEADSIFKENEELRTLINASFSRTAAKAIRCVGDGFEPRAFSTWCPKCLALIGELPATLSDRAIFIPMKRKNVDEVTERLVAGKDQGFTDLVRRIKKWTTMNIPFIENMEPAIPDGLNDRQADSWRELMKISDVAGDRWAGITREVAQIICEKSNDDDDIRTALLRDLQALFVSDTTQTSWGSTEICEILNEDEERPWGIMRNGKGISPNALAQHIRSFGISTHNMKVGGKVKKVYTVLDFTSLFDRYLKGKEIFDLFREKKEEEENKYWLEEYK